MTPVFRDEILVLADTRSTTVGCPVCCGLVVEGDVDVGVVLEFVKLVGSFVGDEDEIHLTVRKRCDRRRKSLRVE